MNFKPNIKKSDISDSVGNIKLHITKDGETEFRIKDLKKKNIIKTADDLYDVKSGLVDIKYNDQSI